MSAERFALMLSPSVVVILLYTCTARGRKPYNYINTFKKHLKTHLMGRLSPSASKAMHYGPIYNCVYYYYYYYYYTSSNYNRIISTENYIYSPVHTINLRYFSLVTFTVFSSCFKCYMNIWIWIRLTYRVLWGRLWSRCLRHVSWFWSSDRTRHQTPEADQIPGHQFGLWRGRYHAVTSAKFHRRRASATWSLMSRASTPPGGTAASAPCRPVTSHCVVMASHHRQPL